MRSGVVVALLVAGCSHRGGEAPSATEAKDRTVQGKEAAPQTSGDDRPLSGSWNGLLVDGGATRIQDALADKGFYHGQRGKSIDTRTRDALRKFQASQNLPSTGLPDHQTVKALGLEQDQVFRSGSNEDKDTKSKDPNDQRI